MRLGSVHAAANPPPNHTGGNAGEPGRDANRWPGPASLSGLNNRWPAASYVYADQPSHVPGSAPSWGYPGQVVRMTVRRAITPGLRATAAPQRAPAASGQLVDELYRGHALRLTRMALLLLGDRPSAEDVVQEAFLGLFRGLGRLSDPGRAVAYLRISVLNGCRCGRSAASSASCPSPWTRPESTCWPTATSTG